MNRTDQRLAAWKAAILEFGIFLLFLVTFADYIGRKIWAVVDAAMKDLEH